jgi:hypothetical protein
VLDQLVRIERRALPILEEPMNGLATVCIAILIGLSASTCCNALDAQKPVPNSTSPAPKPTTLEFDGQPVDPSGVIVTLERAGYLGNPNMYAVTLYGDGRVDWKGREAVEQKGERHSRVEAGAVQFLLKRADELRFFDLADEYSDGVTDVPEIYLTLCVGKRGKRIVFREWGVRFASEGHERTGWRTKLDLIELARAVDVMAETWRWKHVAVDTDQDRVGMSPQPFEIPRGFSVELEVDNGQSGPRYGVSVNTSGNGKWDGRDSVRDIGVRRFDVPYEDLRLLAERLMRARCLDHDDRAGDGNHPVHMWLHVHTDDRDIRRERNVFLQPDAGANQAEDAQYHALIELIAVMTRTERFLGARDDQRHGAVLVR